MANVFKQLQKLKTNIFGGPGNTGFTKPPATRVQDINLQASPTGILGEDPFSANVLSYPKDVQQNFQNGHYMLFYVNVQDKTKYKYGLQDGVDLRETHDEKLKGLNRDEIIIGSKTEEIKGEIDSLYAIHDFLRAFGRQVPKEKLSEMREMYPLVKHPVVTVSYTHLTLPTRRIV